ncbi:MAG: hypothetical protein Q9218_007859 [Villophora microphyllina]
MPSRSNPNVPSKAKRKTAGVLKSKRKHTQRLTNSKANKTAIPRTSQALRQSAPLSGKKARKMNKKEGYAKQRKELERYLESEVEMRDLDAEAVSKAKNMESGQKAGEMDVD